MLDPDGDNDEVRDLKADPNTSIRIRTRRYVVGGGGGSAAPPKINDSRTYQVPGTRYTVYLVVWKCKDWEFIVVPEQSLHCRKERVVRLGVTKRSSQPFVARCTRACTRQSRL